MHLAPDDLVGRNLGPYSLEALIGEGGCAWVFRARRPGDPSVAAVKVLKMRVAGDREFDTRFRNESALAARLIHPNVARIRDVGRWQALTYLVMDYYPDSLAAALAREGPLAEAAVARIGSATAWALAFAHGQGIVHRDVKPANILLADDGTPALSDFGIAGAVSGYVSATGVNMTIGTPHYISPEQVQGRTVDGRSDLYGLGVTLYKAATGDVPFHSSDWYELARMHVEARPMPPRKRRPDLSTRLNRVILRCLAKHPDDRYPSAAALAGELDRLVDACRPTSAGGAPLPP